MEKKLLLIVLFFYSGLDGAESSDWTVVIGNGSNPPCAMTMSVYDRGQAAAQKKEIEIAQKERERKELEKRITVAETKKRITFILGGDDAPEIKEEPGRLVSGGQVFGEGDSSGLFHKSPSVCCIHGCIDTLELATGAWGWVKQQGTVVKEQFNKAFTYDTDEKKKRD